MATNEPSDGGTPSRPIVLNSTPAPGDTTFGSELSSLPPSPIKPTKKMIKSTSERHSWEEAHPQSEEQEARGVHRSLIRQNVPVDPPGLQLEDIKQSEGTIHADNAFATPPSSPADMPQFRFGTEIGKKIVQFSIHDSSYANEPKHLVDAMCSVFETPDREYIVDSVDVVKSLAHMYTPLRDRKGQVSRLAPDGGLIRMGLSTAIIGAKDSKDLPPALHLPTARTLPLEKKKVSNAIHYKCELSWDSDHTSANLMTVQLPAASSGTTAPEANSAVQPTDKELADALVDHFSLDVPTVQTTTVEVLWKKASAYGRLLQHLTEANEEDGLSWKLPGGSESGRSWFCFPDPFPSYPSAAGKKFASNGPVIASIFGCGGTKMVEISNAWNWLSNMPECFDEHEDKLEEDPDWRPSPGEKLELIFSLKRPAYKFVKARWEEHCKSDKSSSSGSEADLSSSNKSNSSSGGSKEPSPSISQAPSRAEQEQKRRRSEGGSADEARDQPKRKKFKYTKDSENGKGLKRKEKEKEKKKQKNKDSDKKNKKEKKGRR